jgi:hypothetical protein
MKHAEASGGPKGTDSDDTEAEVKVMPAMAEEGYWCMIRNFAFYEEPYDPQSLRSTIIKVYCAMERLRRRSDLSTPKVR